MVRPDDLAQARAAAQEARLELRETLDELRRQKDLAAGREDALQALGKLNLQAREITARMRERNARNFAAVFVCGAVVGAFLVLVLA